MVQRKMAAATGKTKRKRIRDGIELIKMSELSKRSGVSAPTLKHFMREGLLPEPELRTSRNMAYYDARLVERIAVIRQLQAERFLPLRVIGDLLEPSPSSQIRAEVDATNRAVMSGLAPVVSQMTNGDAVWVLRDDVLRTWKIPACDLAALELQGALTVVKTSDGPGYAGIDYKLLEVLRSIRALGLDEVFPVSMIAPYLQITSTLVAAEIALFRGRALEAGNKLPLPLGDVARHAVVFGEQMLVLLRSKLLPSLLMQQLK
jgi:DNA-binding transcriptional MerR regulator